MRQWNLAYIHKIFIIFRCCVKCVFQIHVNWCILLEAEVIHHTELYELLLKFTTTLHNHQLKTYFNNYIKKVYQFANIKILPQCTHPATVSDPQWSYIFLLLYPCLGWPARFLVADKATVESKWIINWSFSSIYDRILRILNQY